jgi:hypothetical protein
MRSASMSGRVSLGDGDIGLEDRHLQISLRFFAAGKPRCGSGRRTAVEAEAAIRP